MGSIVAEYLAAYEEGLWNVLKTHPTWKDRQLKDEASLYAATHVPEGKECLVAHAHRTLHRAAEGVDTYSADLGRQIVSGMQSVNHKVLKREPGADTPLPPLRTNAELDSLRVKADPLPASEGGRHIHRPRKAELADLVDRYCAWMDTHDLVPTDSLLGHFTEWSPATWSTVRLKAEERGYRVDSTGRKVPYLRVMARPEPPAEAKVVAAPPAPLPNGVDPEQLAKIAAVLKALGIRL